MRVLVVEDDADLRTLMWRIFADGAHEVAVAADGGEGIEKVHSLRPELVVLDLALPGLDGWAVLRSIQKLPAPPPVVMLSEHSHSETYARAAAAGVAAYVEKPFSVTDLLTACERVVREERAGKRAPRDRRIAPRRIVRVPVQVLDAEQGWWTFGEMTDLAAGGARLAMPFPLRRDREVRMSVAIPGEAQRVNVSGRLQWHAPATRGFAYGMEFVDLRPEAQLVIDALWRASGEGT